MVEEAKRVLTKLFDYAEEQGGAESRWKIFGFTL